MKINWHSKVYRKRQTGKIFKETKWLKLRWQCLERDKFQCQVCKVFFGETSLSLQAHHIRAREDGGKYKLENLVTLCSPCHDKVELGEIDIFHYLPEGKYEIKIEIERNIDWHKWVYGGYQRPSKRM